MQARRYEGTKAVSFIKMVENSPSASSSLKDTFVSFFGSLA